MCVQPRRVDRNPVTPLLWFAADSLYNLFLQLLSSWQDFVWHSASRGPSTVAELVVQFNSVLHGVLTVEQSVQVCVSGQQRRNDVWARYSVGKRKNRDWLLLTYLPQNKSVFSFLRTLKTWHCPRSPSARRCCWAPAVQQSIDISCPPAGEGLRWDRQTDGRTLYSYIDPARRTVRAVSMVGD